MGIFKKFQISLSCTIKDNKPTEKCFWGIERNPFLTLLCVLCVSYLIGCFKEVLFKMNFSLNLI